MVFAAAGWNDPANEALSSGPEMLLALWRMAQPAQLVLISFVYGIVAVMGFARGAAHDASMLLVGRP